MRRYKLFDSWLLLAVCALLGTGIVMVASASIAFAHSRGYSNFHFVYVQFISIVVGLSAGYVITFIPIRFWYKISYLVLFITILMLIITVIPGITRSINGSTRWLFIGSMSIQISEFAKIGAVLYLANYITRREQEIINTISGFVKPLIIFGIISVLLLLQPDFGTVVILNGTAMGLLFLAGVKVSRFIVLGFVMSLGLALIAVAAPYRLKRLSSFLDPWADQFDTGYQLTQSLIAIGSGGIWGKGLGNSMQKLLYLPEAHTDFIFAILAEELGLLGVLIVIGLFSLLIYRIILVAKNAALKKATFASLLAYGIALFLGFQVLVNIGVNVGLLPTKGLTLPFLSYGGSSIIAVLIAIGLVFRVDLESRMH